MSDPVRILEASRDEFIAAAQSVPEALIKTKPGEGRWSALDCVEHVVITEGHFLSWLQNPQPEPAPPENKEKEAMLAQRVPDRSNKRQAPETAVPAGRFTTVGEAVDAFVLAREKTVQFTKEKGAAMPAVSARHPFFGALNGTELIVFIAGHTRRHAAQIFEIKSQIYQ